MTNDTIKRRINRVFWLSVITFIVPPLIYPAAFFWHKLRRDKDTPSDVSKALSFAAPGYYLVLLYQTAALGLLFISDYRINSEFRLVALSCMGIFLTLVLWAHIRTMNTPLMRAKAIKSISN